MSAGVRKQIEQHKIQAGTVNDIILRVFIFLIYPAEDAACFAIDGGDVIKAPGAPEVVHDGVCS